MKSKLLSAVVVFSLSAAFAAPALAGVIVHDVGAFPPGPSIIAVLMALFGA